MNNTDMLILFLVTLCATIFFTWYVKRIFLRARIADNPIVSEHRHKSGTPTMGGVAFLFAICFHFMPIDKPYSLKRSMFATAIGGVLVCIFGTMGLSTFVLWFSYSKQTYLSYFIFRLFQIVPLVANVMLFYPFIPLLRKLKLYWRRPIKVKTQDESTEE
jgi:UDP-N-acetylmuramyl pentapeptide phosphotransferase/UDP-N-acetylglucosamine-1-phosphate transferase